MCLQETLMAPDSCCIITNKMLLLLLSAVGTLYATQLIVVTTSGVSTQFLLGKKDLGSVVGLALNET